MQTVITVENLCRQYVTYKRGESLAATAKSLFAREKVIIDAVKDVSFTVESGEIVGLLGENGAGKSTTIKMLTGVLYPTSGKVDILGYNPSAQRKKYVRNIGAVFGQKSQLIWDIPPMDSFSLNQSIYGIPQALYRQRLERMLDMLHIKETAYRPTRVLSLGERMKCEFVMAMLHEPRVIFLDEPTIGVDIIAKETIHSFIREMNKDGVTFILTTHDLDDIESLARRVIIMNHGEIVFKDSLDALKKHLGDKKNVAVSMKSMYDAGSLTAKSGITLLYKSGEREIELLVDLSVLPMNEFISYISGLGEIQDISIKETGIGTVIKSIYESTI